VDLLIQAAKRVAYASPGLFSVRIIGIGSLEELLRKQVFEEDLTEYITFGGVVKSDGISSELDASDVLVLPSRFDGWGAVVNEALSCGCRVICSGECGSKDLVYACRGGHVFVSDSISDLANKMQSVIDSGPVASRERIRLRSWSKRISPVAAATYLRGVAFGELSDADYLSTLG
jgi:glycosyltransferase involved in cell wall biosynthesis